MKKPLITFSILSICAFTSIDVGAQNCRIIKDSTIAGNAAGNYTDYYRTWTNRLQQTIRYDVMDNNNSLRDTAFYNTDGTLDKTETYYLVGGNLRSMVNLTYDINGRVIRIEESGNNGSVWTKSFDLLYNGVDQITDMILDQTSISGNPEGMMASFRNMTYASGNVTYVELIGDLGMGIDTLEINVVSDNGNNIAPQLMFTEAPDILGRFDTNNMKKLTLVNDEIVGSAGDAVIDRIFTYNANNDVETMEEMATIFNNEAETINFTWDCTVDVNEITVEDVTVYPNPAIDQISINFSNEIRLLEIIDLSGNRIKSRLGDQKELIISDLESGIYILRINEQFSTKFIKK